MNAPLPRTAQDAVPRYNVSFPELHSDGGGDLAVGFVADEVEVFVGDGQEAFEAAEVVFRIADF